MTRVSLGLKEDFPTYLFWGKLNFGTNLVLSKQHNIVLVRVLADMTFLSTHRFDSECLFKKLISWNGTAKKFLNNFNMSKSIAS